MGVRRFVVSLHAVSGPGHEIVKACSPLSRPVRAPRPPASSTPWLAESSFADRLNWLSAVSGLDLAHYGTEADAETIRDTAIAQPLLVAAGLLAALELFPHPADAFPYIGGRRRALGRRDHRRRRRRRAVGRAGDGLRPRARPGDGRGQRRHPDLDDRDHRGQRRRGARRDRGPGSDRRPTTTAAARSSPPAPRSSSPPWPPTRPTRARLIALSVAGAFHTVHMQPAVARLASWPGRSPPTTRGPGCCPTPTARSSTTAARCSAAGRPGRLAGPLGPVHGGDGRPRRHRSAGDAAGRHADRDRQAQPQGRRAVRPQHPRPARRGDGVRPQARRPGHPRRRSPATRPGGWSSRRARASSPGPRTSRTTPCCRASSTVGVVKNLRDEIPVSARTAASSSSGWSRTATRSPPASRCCGCTRRSSPPTPPRSPDDRAP